MQLGTSTGISTLKCPNFLCKCITPYDTFVRKQIVSETGSEPNQAKNKTARQLFADAALEMERVSTISVEPLPKDSVPVFSYVESQESGIISQENALQVVNKLIAFHVIGLTAEEVKNAEDFNNCEIDARLPQTNVQTGTMNGIVIQKLKGQFSTILT